LTALHLISSAALDSPDMTYLQFHLVFTFPAIIALKLAAPRVNLGDTTKKAVSLLAITAIAFLYTTPWDNYLVQHEVWGYGEGRVLATLGYVPIEEYAFFILQPLLTGLWLYRLMDKGVHQPLSQPAAHPWIRWGGTLFWVALSALGAFLFAEASYRYLALILVWACPMIAIQWAYGGHHLWRMGRLTFLAVAVPTLYLWVADRIALALGIWHISETFTTGWMLFGLPIEEALFFLVTNMLVVQGVILLLYTWRFKPLRQPEHAEAVAA